VPAVTPQEPFLGVAEPDGPVRAVALVLHGGRAKSTAPVRARQLAVIRMRPFVSSLHTAGRDAGLAVARLRYLARGWNGAAQAPVHDVRWALGRLADRFPHVPIALVGHSMGGRAALYAAGHHAVRAVVGLAPWLEPGDPDGQLTDRDVLLAHGDRDRTTSAKRSAAYAAAAAPHTALMTHVGVHGEGHAMLHRARLWHELTTGYVLAVLCGRSPTETVGEPAANLVTQALAGAGTLTV
jgi:dienelactone hydrolase